MPDRRDIAQSYKIHTVNSRYNESNKTWGWIRYSARFAVTRVTPLIIQLYIIAAYFAL
jgi:hypothetical protein